MLYVKKRDGRIEPFVEDKIIATCIRSGGSYETCKKIAEEIKSKFTGIISSRTILKYVIKRLKELGEYETAIRYPLKLALYKLETDNLEFEYYIAKLLTYEGFKTKKEGKMYVKGWCIEHEIDVIAEKDGKIYLVECKHHMKDDALTDLTAVLKHYAKFLDIKKVQKVDIPMVVTNTKFTPHAIKFARCYNIVLLGWRFPKERGIERIIEKHKAYPLTLLGLKLEDREKLMKLRIFDTNDLWNLSENKIKELFPTKWKSIIKKLRAIYKD